MSRFSLNVSRTLFYDDLAENNDLPEARSMDAEDELVMSPFNLSCSITLLGHIDNTRLSLSPMRRQGSSLRRQTSLMEKKSLIAVKECQDMQVKATLEAKEPEKESKPMSKLAQYKGTFFILLSAFGFSCSNVVMKRSVYLSPSDHSVIRYFLSFIVMAFICIYNNLKILGPRSEFKLLCVRGLVGSLNVLCVYFSIMFLNPSDATTLIHISIIITSIISRLFLSEKLTLAHFVAIILTANGVLFISKPAFLFQEAPQLVDCQLALSNCTLTNGTTPEPESFYESLKPVIGKTSQISRRYKNSDVILLLFVKESGLPF